jgi:hypothetical protein
MYPMLINNVAQVLYHVHAKKTFFQVGIKLVLLQSAQNLLNMLHVLFPCSVEDRMSSKYNTTKELVKGLNTSSINLMKVVGAFFKRKGMTSHS